MDDSTKQSYKLAANEYGGRTLVLFLLFLLAVLSLKSAGIATFAIVCIIPIMGLFLWATFHYSMFLFGVLMVVNYFISFAAREGFVFLPISLHNEIIEILLIALVVVNPGAFRMSNLLNIMGAALGVWVVYCTLELLNDSCGIGIDVGRWYTGARLMSMQILYAFVICTLYISSPKRIKMFIVMLALMSVFAAFWAWKQQNIGFDQAEKIFLIRAARTHFVNGIIRYFSVFTDAANFGINMAAISAMFLIIAISCKIPFYRIFCAIVGLICLWAMFTSGTRTAIVCFLAAVFAYIFLAKSLKIAVPVIIMGGLFFIFMAFTNIGQGNPSIRRMRSAFDPQDASLNVRDINKEALKKYMKDAPWGIGIGVEQENIPPFNKFKIVSQIPPDSEYVYIWVRTGVVGITVFLVTTAIMWLGACYIVFFSLKNQSLRGLGAAFCCAFVALQLGGYANQILMQFPNVLMFYGSLAIVYLLPKMEPEYEEYENKVLTQQAAIIKNTKTKIMKKLSWKAR